ncbi:MAG: hypothetical protein LBW77_05545, partial [Verrucomicrobiota bacterium]|nr:hypothetical protein [Verrucomicrobiota bacterium]
LLAAIAVALPAAAQNLLIVRDNVQIAANGTGFALNQGINAGINPPTANRITGNAASAANLRYIFTQPADGRAASRYDINNNRIRVLSGGNSGRFVLSANGTAPYDFAPDLGLQYARPLQPAVYDIRISIRNDASGTQRASFGISTADGDVTTWSFGVQLVHPNATATFYDIWRRIDSTSAGVTDINAKTVSTDPTVSADHVDGTWKWLNPILLHVTDAGEESGSAYHSRVQLSLDDGAIWAYDTATDPALPNGFRFGGAGRVFVWDQASTDSQVFYDTFSVTSRTRPAPPPPPPPKGTLIFVY